MAPSTSTATATGTATSTNTDTSATTPTPTTPAEQTPADNPSAPPSTATLLTNGGYDSGTLAPFVADTTGTGSSIQVSNVGGNNVADFHVGPGGSAGLTYTPSSPSKRDLNKRQSSSADTRVTLSVFVASMAKSSDAPSQSDVCVLRGYAGTVSVPLTTFSYAVFAAAGYDLAWKTVTFDYDSQQFSSFSMRFECVTGISGRFYQDNYSITKLQVERLPTTLPPALPATDAAANVITNGDFSASISSLSPFLAVIPDNDGSTVIVRTINSNNLAQLKVAQNYGSPTLRYPFASVYAGQELEYTLTFSAYMLNMAKDDAAPDDSKCTLATNAGKLYVPNIVWDMPTYTSNGYYNVWKTLSVKMQTSAQTIDFALTCDWSLTADVLIDNVSAVPYGQSIDDDSQGPALPTTLPAAVTSHSTLLRNGDFEASPSTIDPFSVRTLQSLDLAKIREINGNHVLVTRVGFGSQVEVKYTFTSDDDVVSTSQVQPRILTFDAYTYNMFTSGNAALPADTPNSCSLTALAGGGDTRKAAGGREVNLGSFQNGVYTNSWDHVRLVFDSSYEDITVFFSCDQDVGGTFFFDNFAVEKVDTSNIFGNGDFEDSAIDMSPWIASPVQRNSVSILPQLAGGGSYSGNVHLELQNGQKISQSPDFPFTSTDTVSYLTSLWYKVVSISPRADALDSDDPTVTVSSCKLDVQSGDMSFNFQEVSSDGTDSRLTEYTEYRSSLLSTAQSWSVGVKCNKADATFAVDKITVERE